MEINHVTYEVPDVSIPQLSAFFERLTMTEVEPDEEVEGKGWVTRWWEDAQGFQVHLVQSPSRSFAAVLGLGHFCAIVHPDTFARLRESGYIEHDSGSGQRAWVQGPYGLRVEIRPASLPASEDSEEPAVGPVTGDRASEKE